MANVYPIDVDTGEIAEGYIIISPEQQEIIRENKKLKRESELKRAIMPNDTEKYYFAVCDSDILNVL